MANIIELTQLVNESPVFSLLKVVPTANLTLPFSSSVVVVTEDGASEVFVTAVSSPLEKSNT